MTADPLSELAKMLVRSETREYPCRDIQVSTPHSNNPNDRCDFVAPAMDFYCLLKEKHHAKSGQP